MRSARAALLPILAVAAFSVAACSDSEGGIAEGDDGAASPSRSSPGSASTSAQSEDAASLDSLDPCSVLTTAKVKEFGPIEVGSPERSEVGGAPACTWHGEAGYSTKPVATSSVVIRTDGGVDVMNDRGSGVQQTEENGRVFARSPGPDVCTIAIGVTETTRVDVGVSGVETGQACEIANALVEAAEPNVPRG